MIEALRLRRELSRTLVEGYRTQLTGLRFFRKTKAIILNEDRLLLSVEREFRLRIYNQLSEIFGCAVVNYNKVGS